MEGDKKANGAGKRRGQTAGKRQMEKHATVLLHMFQIGCNITSRSHRCAKEFPIIRSNWIVGAQICNRSGDSGVAPRRRGAVSDNYLEPVKGGGLRPSKGGLPLGSLIVTDAFWALEGPK